MRHIDMLSLGGLVLLLPFAVAQSVSDKEHAEIRDELIGFQNIILDDFESSTSYDLLKEDLHKKIVPKKKAFVLQNEADKFAIKLQKSIDKKIQALRDIVDVAERTATSFSANPEPFDTSPEYVDLKNKTVVHQATNLGAKKVTSGVHIPVEVYKHEVRVERDISWLSTIDVTEALRTNVLRDKSLFRQYVSAETGITAVYPASEWNQMPAEYTVDLYDPRYRPWYVATVSAPKDILFLLDFSGSIAGQTARLMKLTVMSVLALLTANDYINAVWFNNKVGKVLPCVKDHNFIPATSRNKVLLMRKLEQTDPENVANFVQALNFTFDQFDSDVSSMFARSEHRSGGHKVVMVLTDWIESWADDEVKSQLTRHGTGNNTKVRFFGFAMGYDAVHIELLEWMACKNKGYYSIINSISDVRQYSRAFVPILSRPMALRLKEIPLADRPVTWTGPYMDAQGQGAVITVSMPILNTMVNGSRQSVLGVAAIDIKVEHIREQFLQLYTGFDAYPFAVDNNGHVVLHPREYLPVPDIQLVRRTACFPLGVRWGSGAKVVFSPANEDIIQQLGYIDSIFTLDILEIESENAATRELRERMVHGKCPLPKTASHPLLTTSTGARGRTVSYTCRRIKHVPLAIAVAASDNAVAVEYTNAENGVTDLNQEYTNAMRVVLPPRRLCANMDLSTLMPLQRNLQNMFATGILAHCLPESRIQDAGRLPPPVSAAAGSADDDFVPLLGHHVREFVAMAPWRDTFTHADDTNVTNCELASSLLSSFAKMVFVQMASGTSYVYPSLLGLKSAKKCWHLLLPNTLKHGFDRSSIVREWQDAYLNETSQFHVNQMVEYFDAGVGHSKERRILYVFITRPLVIDQVFLGVTGAIVATGTIQDAWYNYTMSSNALFRQCHESGRTCYLLTSDVHVLAASNSYTFNEPKHLSSVDWDLFDYLYSIGKLTKRSERDYQARCKRNGSQRGILTGSPANIGTNLPTVKTFLYNIGSATLHATHVLLSWAVGGTLPGYQHSKARRPAAKRRHRVSHTHRRSDCPYGRNVMERDTESCLEDKTIYEFVQYLPDVSPMVNDRDHRCIRAFSGVLSSPIRAPHFLIGSDPRLLTLYSLNDTNLRVLSADPPCQRPIAPPAGFSTMKRVGECEAMVDRSRIPPPGTIYKTFHSDERFSDCIAAGSVFGRPNTFYGRFFVVLYLFHFVARIY